jgi:hypothetical protein
VRNSEFRKGVGIVIPSRASAYEHQCLTIIEFLSREPTVQSQYCQYSIFVRFSLIAFICALLRHPRTVTNQIWLHEAGNSLTQ